MKNTTTTITLAQVEQAVSTLNQIAKDASSAAAFRNVAKQFFNPELIELIERGARAAVRGPDDGDARAGGPDNCGRAEKAVPAPQTARRGRTEGQGRRHAEGLHAVADPWTRRRAALHNPLPPRAAGG